MGLFDLAAQALGGGGQTTDGQGNAVNAVLHLINNYPGGIGGLISSFQQHGLGGVVSSWISTGPNQPISPDQVQGALGNQTIQDLATRFGISPDVASSVLSQALPHVVDHLTPDGQVPTGDNTNLLSMGESILKGFIK